MIRKNKG